MEEVKFDPKFTELIRDGKKTSTIRYWNNLRLLPGEPFVAKEDTEEEEIIENLTVEDVEQRPAWHIVEHGVEGHRDYDSVEELIEELEDYYPEADITEDTILQIPKWKHE